MKRALSVSMMSASAIVAVVGAAKSVQADVPITPPSVYAWNSFDYGAGAGNAPGAVSYNGAAGTPTWSWIPITISGGNPFNSAPVIDSNGRIYAIGTYHSNPAPASLTTASNLTGIFTASRGINNSPDLNLFQSWAACQTDPNPANSAYNYKFTSNAGSATAIFSPLKVSGTMVGLGAVIGNPLNTAGAPAINESTSGSGAGATLQNNQELFTTSYPSTTSFSARTGSVLALPNTQDWTMTPSGTVSGNDQTLYRSGGFTGQAGDMNSSGTCLAAYTLATVGPNPATASVTANATTTGTSGNNTFLGTVSSSGTLDVIARAGDLAFGAGSVQFCNNSSNGAAGTQNGVGGNFAMIARNGSVFYDASFLSRGTGTTNTSQPNNGFTAGPGGITNTNDSTAWIYNPNTPGTRFDKNVQIYNEGDNVPVHTDPISGLQTSDGSSRWTGAIQASAIGGSFSNAGAFYQATAFQGNNLVTSGQTQNNNFYLISDAAHGTTPTFVMRQNDIAPGFSAASNVHLGTVAGVGMHINNNGQVAFHAFLQSTDSTSVTANVSPVTSGGLVTTPGNGANNTAVFTGMPGGTGPTALHMIARTGDPAPGFNGAYLDLSAANNKILLNNAGDVVLTASLTANAGGAGTIGTVGQPLPPTVSFSQTVLYAYNVSYGLVPLIYTGEAVDVGAGSPKYVASFNANSSRNGDGGMLQLNDNGQLVLQVNLSDNPINGAVTPSSTAYIVLQVPTPGAGAMALLGVGLLARRRRR
jgi:hypothetical protein